MSCRPRPVTQRRLANLAAKPHDYFGLDWRPGFILVREIGNPVSVEPGILSRGEAAPRTGIGSEALETDPHPGGVLLAALRTCDDDALDFGRHGRLPIG